MEAREEPVNRVTKYEEHRVTARYVCGPRSVTMEHDWPVLGSYLTSMKIAAGQCLFDCASACFPDVQKV